MLLKEIRQGHILSLGMKEIDAFGDSSDAPGAWYLCLLWVAQYINSCLQAAESHVSKVF